MSNTWRERERPFSEEEKGSPGGSSSVMRRECSCFLPSDGISTLFDIRPTLEL